MAEMNNLAKPQETLVVNLNKTVKKKFIVTQSYASQVLLWFSPC